MKKIIALLVLMIACFTTFLKAEEFPIHCVKRFPFSQIPFESVEFNGKMYFRTGTNLRQCIMVTEGDSSTTKIVYDSLVISNFDLVYFQVFEDKLYFSCLRNKKPCFITIDKNEKVDSIMLQGIPNYTTVFNNKLVFSQAFPYFQNGYYSYYPKDIYELDSNKPNHVSLIDSIDNPFPGYSVERFISNGNNLYYTGIRRSYNNMFQLFCSSGVGTKSIQLTKIPFVVCSNSYLNFFEKFGDELYFDCIDDTNGIALFLTDGSEQNTRMVKDIFTGNSCKGNGVLSSSFDGFTAYKNEIYFFGRDTINGFQLWKTNGDSAGTRLVKKINYTSNLDNPFSNFAKLMYVFDNKLYITNDQIDTIHGNELYVFDGNNFEYLDLIKGIKGTSPHSFFEHNKHLYFIGTDSNSSKTFLWKTNGTVNGTSIQHYDKLSEIGFDNSLFNTVQSFKSYNGSLYFEANYDGLGWGLYRLDDFEPPTKKVDSTLIEQLLCYPNPTKEILNIKFTTLVSENCNLSLTDMHGRIIYQENFISDAATNNKQINISKFAIGTYIVRISYPDKSLKSKIEIYK